MKRLLLTAMVGALACGTAMADRWHLVVTSGKPIEVAWYINFASIERNKNTAKAWLLLANFNRQQEFDAALELREVNCKKKQSRILQADLYKNYKYVRTINQDPYEYMTPGSAAELIGKVICNPQPQNHYFFYFDDPKDLARMLLE
jgi:hypothetical protein